MICRTIGCGLLRLGSQALARSPGVTSGAVGAARTIPRGSLGKWLGFTAHQPLLRTHWTRDRFSKGLGLRAGPPFSVGDAERDFSQLTSSREKDRLALQYCFGGLDRFSERGLRVAGEVVEELIGEVERLSTWCGGYRTFLVGDIRGLRGWIEYRVFLVRWLKEIISIEEHPALEGRVALLSQQILALAERVKMEILL